MSGSWWIKRLAFVWLGLLFGLNYIAYTSLQTEAGKLLDLRPLGYSLDQAAAYAASLDLAARNEYSQAYLYLDYPFIIVTTILLILVAFEMPRPWSSIIVSLAVLFALTDVTENLLNYRTITSPEFIEFDPWRITLASGATIAKFLSLTFAALFVLIGRRRKDQQ